MSCSQSSGGSEVDVSSEGGRSGAGFGGAYGARGGATADEDIGGAGESGSSVGRVDAAVGIDTPGDAGASAGRSGAGGMTTPAPLDHFVYVGGSESNVIGYKLDVTTGALTSLGKTPAGDHPGYLASSPSGKNLYVADENGSVRAFKIEPGTGRLTAQSDCPSGGAVPVHVSVHPTGRWLFVSNYVGGNVRVFPLNEDGDIEEASDTQASCAESHQIVVAPTGDFVFVPCRGPNHVVQFKFDVIKGKLLRNDPPTTASDDPRHIAFHPGANVAYLINENPATLISFVYEASGQLGAPQKLPLAMNEQSGSHVVVTSSGKFVYVGGRSTDRIYGFSIKEATGRLTAIGSSSGAGDIATPRDFALDPSDQYLIVGNQDRGTVTVLQIGSDGGLAKVGASMAAVTGAQAVVVVSVPRPSN